MNTATDWDLYYRSVPVTAKLTRKYTTRVLLDAIRRYCEPADKRGLSIVEFGGANSCFVESVIAAVDPRSYDVVDTNSYGLSLLTERLGTLGVVRLREQSVLSLPAEPVADLVFSVGLIEHFDPQSTRKAVLAHFDALRPGGVAIITYPTPTLLYRIARRALELAGLWKFHDERPLQGAEVIPTIRERADVVFEKILWPLILTQTMVVAKKRSA